MMVVYKTGSGPVMTDYRENSIVPRIGEHIQTGGFKYTVLMVTHYKDDNVIEVSLEKHFKFNRECHAVQKELLSKG